MTPAPAARIRSRQRSRRRSTHERLRPEALGHDLAKLDDAQMVFAAEPLERGDVRNVAILAEDRAHRGCAGTPGQSHEVEGAFG
jgi:hypothetical protein